jgi:anti-anti-sigma factor
LHIWPTFQRDRGRGIDAMGAILSPRNPRTNSTASSLACASTGKCRESSRKRQTYVCHWIFAEGSVEIGERREGDILILLPAGRIDNDTSAAFQARLLAALASPAAAVLVDFSGVEYISSAGLRALMMGSRQAKAVKGRLAVAALGPVVKEIFEISRFSLVVQVYETSAEALAALR